MKKYESLMKGRNVSLKKLTILTISSVILCVSIVTFSMAEDEQVVKLKPGVPIVVDGDKVEYFENKKKITAEGNVTIKYDDVTLYCDSIEVNTDTQQARCSGNVRVESPEGVLTGDEITYDVLNKRGGIESAEVKAFPWFGKADDTERVGDEEYLLHNGYITTCDLDNPHYRISAGEIRVFSNDKIIAKNAVIYIGDVPVMWFPYYYHPIVQTKSKVQFIPGYNSDWGYFLLSAWRFHINGNTKIDMLLDYRTKKGFAEGANLYYNMEDLLLPGLGQGLLRVYFIQQNGPGTYAPSAFGDEGTDLKDRSRVEWTHRLDFDPQTVGMVELNKLSDENVLKDYFFNEYEENNLVPDNYVSVVTVQPNYMLTLEMAPRLNDFFTVTQRLPEAKLEIPAQSLWGSLFYYSSENSATVFSKEYKGEEKAAEEVNRVDTFHKLSYVSKLGFLNVTPYGTFRETFYSRNKYDDKILGRNIFGGGVNVFSRFNKVYDYKTDFLGLDINDIRHLIVPKADYFYNHQPSVDKDELYQMDDLDTLEKENGVRLSLENKLQTKRHSGKKLVPVDLVRFIVSTDYLFRIEKDAFKFKKEGKFTDVDLDLEVKPYDWFYVDGELKVMPQNQAIRSGSMEFDLFPNEKFRMGLDYRYEKIPIDPRNTLTFDIMYMLNPKWRVGAYERMDLYNGRIDEQQFSVTRDLHCWEVEVTYDLKGSNPFQDEYTIWVAFRIKAFPDLQIGLSRSFSKRAPGAGSTLQN